MDKRTHFVLTGGQTNLQAVCNGERQRAENNPCFVKDNRSFRAGNSFDAVFLPRLIPKSFGAFSEARIERLVFVALTRATRWAYFSTVLGNSCPFLEKLLPLERSRKLTVLCGDHKNASPTAAPAAEPARAANDLDFL